LNIGQPMRKKRPKKEAKKIKTQNKIRNPRKKK
jgi:hypothetical protein